MSQEDYQKFMAALADDKAMQKELNDRYGTEHGVPAEGLRSFAAEKGYEFRFQETGELSEEEMESAAGGSLSYDTVKFYDTTSPTLFDLHKVDSAYYVKIEW